MGSGLAMAAGEDAQRLVSAGVVVVGFNAAGRGSNRPWDPRSSGTADFNGPQDQDDLAAIIRYVAAKRWVASSNLGLATVSYGLVAAAGCLSRHRDLPIRYLVDEEGPSDRFDAMLRAWTLATVDAPDWPQRAADLFGVTPEDDDFWRPREPGRTIGQFRGAYLRLQAEFDHVQPPCTAAHRPLFHQPPRWWQNKHAVTLVNAAVAGGVPWVRVNLPRQGNPANTAWSMHSPPNWLEGTMSKHPQAWVEAVHELSHPGPSRAQTYPKTPKR